jgi:hypothetical protein
MTIDIGSSEHLKTYLEVRKIRSMKGKILISDLYGELLYTMDGIELNAENSIPTKPPGLSHALDEQIDLITTRTHKYELYVDHPSHSVAFKNAVRNGTTLKIEFVPDYKFRRC